MLPEAFKAQKTLVNMVWKVVFILYIWQQHYSVTMHISKAL